MKWTILSIFILALLADVGVLKHPSTNAMGLAEQIKNKIGGVKRKDSNDRLSFACVGIDQDTLPDEEALKQKTEMKREIEKEEETKRIEKRLADAERRMSALFDQTRNESSFK